jgi:membrane protein
MSDEPRDVRPRKPSLNERLRAARSVTWSILTDPAVLVYRRSAQGKKRFRVLMVEFFLFLRETFREFYAIEGTSRAGALAFTTLFSLIPLLVAFTQILRSYFSKIFPDFQTQVDTLLNVVIPYQSPQLAYHLQRFAENAQAASTFGAIIFMFISFRLFLAVENTINQIWKVRSARGYRQKIIAFTMLFFWGPLLMGLSFTTTATLQKNRFLRVFVNSDIVFVLVPIVVLFIAFTMLFWLVPSTKVRFQAALIGGLVTTSLFSLVRYGFGVYAQHLFNGRLNVIYGTVGLAVIFLIAIEVMWIVILLGVEVSFVYQNLYGLLRATEKQLLDEPKYDLYFALRGLVEIARRFDRREEAPSSYRLAEMFGSTDTQMMRILRKLEDAQLVKEIGGDWTGFVPGGDPDRITIEEVIATMEGGNRAVPDTDAKDVARHAISGLFDTLARCTTAAFERRSVGQLVRELYGVNRPSRIEDRFTKTQ